MAVKLLDLFTQLVICLRDWLILTCKPIVPVVAWVWSVVIGVSVPPLLVTGGKGWVKVFWSSEFAEPKKAFALKVIEIFSVGLGLTVLPNLLENLLWQYLSYVPAITAAIPITLVFLFYLDYGFHPPWTVVIPLILVPLFFGYLGTL